MSTENTNVTCLFQEVLEDLYLREEATAPRCVHTGSCNMSSSNMKNRMKDNYRWWWLLLTLSPHSDWESHKCQENKQCSRGFPRIFPREAQENPWHVGGTRTERQHQKLNTENIWRISLTVRRGQWDLDITPRRISVALNSWRKPATSCT